MRGWCEQFLTKAEEEAPKIKEQAANAPSVKRKARRAADQVKAAAGTDGRPGSHATQH